MLHADREQAFGFDHDLSGIRAHIGGPAAAAAEAIGATAYATGNDIAFASAPDLHTAAHEAAHVVQQRAGVHLQRPTLQVLRTLDALLDGREPAA